MSSSGSERDPEYLPPVTTRVRHPGAPVAGAQPAPVPRPAGADGAAAAARSGASAVGGRGAGGAGPQGALRLAAQGLHEGAPAGRRARRSPARRPERAPPARALRSRLDHGRLARLDRSPGSPFSFTGHAKDVYSHVAQPGRPAAPQAAGGDASRSPAPRRGARAPAAGLPADAGALRLSRPERRPRAARRRSAAAPLGQRLAARARASGGWCPRRASTRWSRRASLLADRGVEVEATLAGEDGEHSDEIRRLIAARGVGRRFELAGPIEPERAAPRLPSAPTSSACPAASSTTATATGSRTSSSRRWPAACPSSPPPVSGIPELVRDERQRPARAARRSRARWPRRCCDCGRDPELAARLGRAGRESVLRRFDGDALARRLAALFEEAIA